MRKTSGKPPCSKRKSAHQTIAFFSHLERDTFDQRERPQYQREVARDLQRQLARQDLDLALDRSHVDPFGAAAGAQLLQHRPQGGGQAGLHGVRGSRRHEAELGEVAADALPVSDAVIRFIREGFQKRFKNEFFFFFVRVIFSSGPEKKVETKEKSSHLKCAMYSTRASEVCGGIS